MQKKDEFWIGFDLGGTKMLACGFDGALNPMERVKKRTKGADGSDTVIQRIIDTIQKTIDQSGKKTSDLRGIGIGVPGTIDVQTGVVLAAPNLGWRDIPVKALIEDHFDTKVVLCNDVDAGIYGEYSSGAAKGAYCAVGIFPGTGVGGGCVLNGHIFQGKYRTAMEIGHIPFFSGGTRDGAGNEGTLETVASRLAISAAAAQAAFRGAAPHLMKSVGTDLSEIKSGALADAILNGDKSIKEIVLHAANYIGQAIVTLIHLFGADKVVLGGGLVQAMPDLIVNNAREYVMKHVLASFNGTFEISAASLGDDAAIVGAATWAKKQLAETEKGKKAE